MGTIPEVNPKAAVRQRPAAAGPGDTSLKGAVDKLASDHAPRSGTMAKGQK